MNILINRVNYLAIVLLGIVSCESSSLENIYTVTIEKECVLDPYLAKEIAGYKPIVNRIVDEVTRGKHKGKTYQELANFIDIFGNRLAGTDGLENAIDFMINKSVKNNLDNVHGEPVQVPTWTR